MIRREHKYNAQRVEHFAGYSFASKLEASVFGLLMLMEKAGELSQIKVQPHVFLTNARIQMIPDFQVFDEKLKETVFYEAKGFETDIWRIKKKLWKVYGPGRLRIFKGTFRSPKCTEEIIPKNNGGDSNGD